MQSYLDSSLTDKEADDIYCTTSCGLWLRPRGLEFTACGGALF